MHNAKAGLRLLGLNRQVAALNRWISIVIFSLREFKVGFIIERWPLYRGGC